MYWIQTLKLGDIHRCESDILSKRWTMPVTGYEMNTPLRIATLAWRNLPTAFTPIGHIWTWRSHPHARPEKKGSQGENKGSQGGQLCPPPSTWKVPPSPSRLVAKSGVWIAVAANILCTLLPSGSWPNWTIWAQGIEFKFINKYCDLSRADIIVQGNDLAEYLSLTLRLPHGRPKGRNPSQNWPLLLCCNCVHWV